MDKYRVLLSRYFKPYLRQAAWSGALLLAGVILRLLNPQILRNFIDAAVGHAAGSVMLGQAGWYLGIAILIQALAVPETWRRPTLDCWQPTACAPTWRGTAWAWICPSINSTPRAR